MKTYNTTLAKYEVRPKQAISFFIKSSFSYSAGYLQKYKYLSNPLCPPPLILFLTIRTDSRTTGKKELPQGTSPTGVQWVLYTSFCQFPHKIIVTFKTIRPPENKRPSFICLFTHRSTVSCLSHPNSCCLTGKPGLLM